MSDDKLKKLQEIEDSTIQEINDILLEKMAKLRLDDDEPILEKAARVNVLYNTIHFLKDYKTNIKILNDKERER